MASPRLLRRSLIATLSAVMVASVATGAAQADPPKASAAAAAAFSDNFDGAAGSAVDSSKWQIETGDNVNNHERQYYTTSPSNASLDGQGNLVITARPSRRPSST